MNVILRITLFFLLTVFSVSKSNAQGCGFLYPFNPVIEISNYSFSWQHVGTSAFEYRFNVTAGTTYEWSLCSEDGANNGNVNTGAYYLAFSDSNENDPSMHYICGSEREKITWVAEYTGAVYIQSNDRFCNTILSDIVYRAYNCNEITNVSITSSSNAVCQSATVSLSLPSLPNVASIQWLMNGSEIPFANSATYNTNQGNALYSATLNIPGTSCASQNTNTIFLQGVSADIQSTTPQGEEVNTVICNGAPIILQAYVENAISYEWIYNGNLIPNITSSYNVSQIGEYIVNIAFQGCTVSDTVQVTSGQTPQTPLIIPLGSLTFCEGGSVLLDGSTLSGYTYQWEVNGTPIPFAIYNSFLTDSSGEYSLTIVNGDGCHASSNTLVVTVNPCVGLDFIQNESIHVYPNPVIDQLHIEIPPQHSLQSHTILDMQGRPVAVSEVKQTESHLELPNLNLAAGMYQLILKTDKAQFVKRIIVSSN